MSIIFRAPSSVVRAVWVTPDHVYAGTCHDKGEHQLAILDNRGEVVRTWRTPYLVSDVALAGDTCHASLGPGYLLSWDERGLGTTAPKSVKVDANAPKFAVFDDELWWGTSWGEIHTLATGLVTSVKKWLGSLCVDAERIYAGYVDGNVRVFSRAGKRVKQLKLGGKGTLCAVGPDTLVTQQQMTGVATISTLDFEPSATFTHEHEAPYGVIGLAIYGTRIVSHTYEDVQIHDLEGRRLARWRPPEGKEVRLEDVWLEGDILFVAVGPHLYRLALAELD